MKYQNFSKVKSIVETIDKNNKIIGELKGDNISVKILDGQFTIMTIGIWSNCEHCCQDIAESFVKKVREHYELELEKLHTELSKL